ncbi:MAG: aldehyde dehydrogenase family protein, partial [Gammaproteobacteria bacterium]|nr:aldehyde dehydrogenase family protein [Gammaproteobacteria bacterium]
MESINPTTGERLKTFDMWSDARTETALAAAAAAAPAWQATSYAERAQRFRAAAAELRNNIDYYASLITLEMGKIAREARAEIEKCALGCEFYAAHAEAYLRDEKIGTEASSSYVAYQPLGTVLAIMPWNFPFWQVFRFAAPNLMAGNNALLKHASNVPQCALAIEEIFHKSGFPDGVFQTLLISAAQAEKIIADPRIQAVTLTGSEAAGRKVAAAAGAALKKAVLELGGSDAFIVLPDADLNQAVEIGIASRFLNCGQSCIAAKRFILVESIADTFLEKFKRQAHALRRGDPARDETQLGPMARADLRDTLHR